MTDNPWRVFAAFPISETYGDVTVETLLRACLAYGYDPSEVDVDRAAVSGRTYVHLSVPRRVEGYPETIVVRYPEREPWPVAPPDPTPPPTADGGPLPAIRDLSVQFTEHLTVSTAEMAEWSLARIEAFFAGVAMALSAKDGEPKPAAWKRAADAFGEAVDLASDPEPPEPEPSAPEPEPVVDPEPEPAPEDQPEPDPAPPAEQAEDSLPTGRDEPEPKPDTVGARMLHARRPLELGDTDFPLPYWRRKEPMLLCDECQFFVHTMTTMQLHTDAAHGREPSKAERTPLAAETAIELHVAWNEAEDAKRIG